MENEKAKILIIDDDPGIGEMLKTLLEFNDYTARVTDKPLQAREIIMEYAPDIVLLDVRLSGVDGTEVCANLKQDKEVNKVPIIMMSALTGADKTCEKAGAQGFISKPFDMEDLLEKIKIVFSKEQAKNS